MKLRPFLQTFGVLTDCCGLFCTFSGYYQLAAWIFSIHVLGAILLGLLVGVHLGEIWEDDAEYYKEKFGKFVDSIKKEKNDR